MTYKAHPEDTHEFSRSEKKRLKGIGLDRKRIIEELSTIRENLRRAEVDLQIQHDDTWSIAEDISRQISRIDRLSDALK